MIAGPLLSWYDQRKRDLPWRVNTDPYRVWVSEIMLQQTTVAAVIPYFQRWMARFPTLEDLASAEESEVMALWQGLGYYRRGRLLHQGARQVAARGWPRNAEEWRQIPGVGAYTAGAICSIALGQPEALVDGNVARVFSRLFCRSESGPKLLKEAWEWAGKEVPPSRPGDYNQALMELGATVCTPRQPSCPQCPLAGKCQAREAGTVDQFPVAAPKPSVIHLTHHVWAVKLGSRWGLRQIPKGEWWEGLWEMPRASDPGGEEALASWLGVDQVQPLGSFRHTVTRHRIELLAGWVEVETPPEGLVFLEPVEVDQLPLAAPQRRVWRMVQARGQTLFS